MKTTILSLAVATFLALSGCANLRSVGNNETQIMEPAECDSIGVIERDDGCYQRTIISAKSDGHVIITKSADGTIIYDVDNSGQPSFAHDMAATIQAIALQKAMSND